MNKATNWLRNSSGVSFVLSWMSSSGEHYIYLEKPNSM